VFVGLHTLTCVISSYVLDTYTICSFNSSELAQVQLHVCPPIWSRVCRSCNTFIIPRKHNNYSYSCRFIVVYR
jgi:hypothetical protein